MVFKIITEQTSFIKVKHRDSCNWNCSTEVGSTERDVVLLYATNIGKGLKLCIKSLRSTGAKCRIILFLPKELEMDRNQSNYFYLFEVTIVRINPRLINGKNVPHMDRYEHERDWLMKNIDNVDRVLHTDAFDVFFQGDPFIDTLKNDSLLLALEPHQFRSCGWNSAWVRECYGGAGMSTLYDNFILCSGSIGGSAREYIKLLNLMLSQEEWERCWDNSKDQPILNYLIWTGKVRESNISYSLTGCNGGFFTMQWCVKMNVVNFNEHGQIVSLMNTVPSYIHQYTRFDELTKLLYEKCGI